MPRSVAAARPHKVNGFWYLVRRVPARFAAVDPRGIVRLTTGIRVADDPRGVRAAEEVRRLDAALVQYWEDRLAGKDTEARARFERAVNGARALGFNYVPAATAAASLPLDDILRRLEAIAAGNRAESEDTVAAVLGGVEPPELMVSDLLTEFQRVRAIELSRKSARQRRRWEVNRQTALNNFIAFIGGDRPLRALTAADVLRYRDHLRQRVAAGELNTDTANKALGRVGSMFRAVNDDRRLGLPDVFAKARVGTAKYKPRPSYDRRFFQEVFLREGMFDGINEEARRIVYLMVETGLRPAEACSLQRHHIHLNAPVPYIEVKPDGRELKTEASERVIPLVGVSLMAMRHHPDGFPRYWDRADNLSADINKALRVRGLSPGGQTIYSIRHMFEDRLLAAKLPDNVIADFMGHERARPRYGDGLTLAEARDVLQSIAFVPPSRV